MLHEQPFGNGTPCRGCSRSRISAVTDWFITRLAQELGFQPFGFDHHRKGGSAQAESDNVQDCPQLSYLLKIGTRQE